MAGETERNKPVIRRFVEEVQNKKDWDVYDELKRSGVRQPQCSAWNPV